MARYKGKHKKKLKFKKMNLVLLFSIVYSIIVLYQVISIDILPTKYVIAAISAYTIINLIFLLLINVKKKLLRAFFFIFSMVRSLPDFISITVQRKRFSDMNRRIR